MMNKSGQIAPTNDKSHVGTLYLYVHAYHDEGVTDQLRVLCLNISGGPAPAENRRPRFIILYNKATAVYMNRTL